MRTREHAQNIPGGSNPLPSAIDLQGFTQAERSDVASSPELDLFTAPAQRHSATSIAAAESIQPKAQTLREKVLAFIQCTGRFGATDEAIQFALQMDPSTERPRRVELVKAGLVIDSGKTRLTRSGKQAVVWRVAHLPHQQAA